ncbi:MAG: hypothetical protein ABL996_12610, partial [Micropepsaceae bacterium]
MTKTMTLLAATIIAASTIGAPVQAASFFNGLLGGTNWQPPKCNAPEVLREVKDAHGKILWRCV